LKGSLREAYRKELIVGTTLYGPHRDDLSINLDGVSARNFGSQGEVRSLVLAMRLAEVAAHRDVMGFGPILLIDDFSSELDAQRRKFLLEYLVDSPSQVFLSTTEDITLGKTFLVNQGQIASPGAGR
jgi:DNA replication and repair protein RecF